MRRTVAIGLALLAAALGAALLVGTSVCGVSEVQPGAPPGPVTCRPAPHPVGALALGAGIAGAWDLWRGGRWVALGAGLLTFAIGGLFVFSAGLMGLAAGAALMLAGGLAGPRPPAA